MQDEKSTGRPFARCRVLCGTALARLAQGFAIDVRSLAVFRMALALMVLVDLAERLPDLTAHYTDAGVLPRAARVAMESNGSSTAGRWAWSLHMASGTTAGQAMLFFAAACCAVSMLAGYRTRLATIACWLFTVSIYYRNPMLEDAGDTILRTILFWSMFLPLSAAASIDRLLEADAARAPRQIISPSGVALLLQICMLYWATAAEKHSPVWVSDHTALYYTLSLDAFATPFGRRLLAYPQLLKWLTAAVYWLEWLAPVMVLLPIRRGLVRLVVVLAVWSMHLGTALTLELGALPWISMAIWTVFLPGAVWDRLGWRWQTGEDRQPEPSGAQPKNLSESRWRMAFPGRPVLWHSPRAGLGRPSSARRASMFAGFAVGRDVLVAALALYTIVWNINQVTGSLDEHLPRRWKVPAYVLGLEQTWRMFAPFPITDDGWYEMRGVLADGSVVNLWQADRPLARRKPASVAETYRNRRWRKYLIELRGRWAAFLPEFVDWLARRWNAEHAGETTERRVKHIDLIYHVEQTLSPERASTLVVPEIVYEGDVGGMIW